MRQNRFLEAKCEDLDHEKNIIKSTDAAGCSSRRRLEAGPPCFAYWGLGSPCLELIN